MAEIAPQLVGCLTGTMPKPAVFPCGHVQLMGDVIVDFETARAYADHLAALLAEASKYAHENGYKLPPGGMRGLT